MSNEKVAPEGNATVTGGAVETKVDQAGNVQEFIDKVKKEKENWKQKALDLEKTLTGKVEQELVAKEEWKTLAEQRLQKTLEAESKLNSLNETIVKSQKIGALKTELGKLGMAPDVMEMAIQLVDLKTVNVDSEHNVVTGADTAVKVIRDKLPQLFTTTPAGVSHAAPQGQLKPLTLDEWRQLPVDEKIKREQELYKTLGIQRRP